MIDNLGSIPQRGESFDACGLHVEVSATDSRRVLEIVISMEKAEEAVE